MKIRERKIRRTITVNAITVKHYCEETDEVTTQIVPLVGDYSESEIKAILTEKGLTVLKIIEISKSELKYEMSEEDFVKNGRLVSNEKKTDNDE